uniref:Clone 916 transcribed RNA sequence n=1 Tax=Plectreurys tristis TaxID=33319 RepID=A0A0C4W5R6_PLETR|nr:hypothetical protein [Plectreurys tristis]
MRTLLIALAVYLSNTDVTLAEQPCHTADAQACLNYVFDYINTLPRRSLPETSEQVGKLCGTFKETTACWNKYKSSCMTPLQKELESIILSGAQKQTEDFCADGSEQKRIYVEHAPCLNKVATSEETNGQIQYLLAAIEKLLTSSEHRSFSFLCCGFTTSYDNIKAAAVKTCGEEAANAGERLILSVITEFPNFVCGGYDSKGEECKKWQLPEGSKPTSTGVDNAIFKFIAESLKNYVSLELQYIYIKKKFENFC